MTLLPIFLAVSMASEGGRVAPCDAPMLAGKGGLQVGVSAVFDSIALAARPTLSAADSQAVRDARVDIGMRCAISVMANLGGLRVSELQTTSGICRDLRSGGNSIETPPLSWRGYDRIAVCTLYLTRDKENGSLLHAALWIVATGGHVEENGSKLVRQYEVRLERRGGSRSWSVTRYAVRMPE